MKIDTRLVLRTMALACATLSLGACATNQKVSTNQLSDAGLTCAQITSQDKELDAVLEKANMDPTKFAQALRGGGPLQVMITNLPGAPVGPASPGTTTGPASPR